MAIDLTKLITAEQKAAQAQATTLATFDAGIEEWMNAKAVTMGYNSMDRAISYADEPAVPQYQKEGQALRAWRSTVWKYAHEQMDLVIAGKRPVPTLADFLAELPQFTLEVK